MAIIFPIISDTIFRELVVTFFSVLTTNFFTKKTVHRKTYPIRHSWGKGVLNFKQLYSHHKKRKTCPRLKLPVNTSQ